MAVTADRHSMRLQRSAATEMGAVTRPTPRGSADIESDRHDSSLAHGLSLLSCFSPQEPVLGLGEISERVELSREVVKRYAQALVELGYLDLGANGKYRLGGLALRLGLSAVRIGGLAEVVRPWLCWMRARTGLTASLAILDGEDLDYVAWLPSRRGEQARLAGRVERAGWVAGHRVRWSTTAHSRAAGLALLAYTAEGRP